MEFIVPFVGAFIGAFLGFLLAKTERKIPVITKVKEVVQGQQEAVEHKRIQAWLYGEKGGGS